VVSLETMLRLFIALSIPCVYEPRKMADRAVESDTTTCCICLTAQS